MAPTFDYSAKDRQGNTVTGAIDASSDAEAAKVLRERNLLPNRIFVRSESAFSAVGGAGHWFISPPLGEQIHFFRQLATMLRAGVSVSESLGKMAERDRPGRLRNAVCEAARHASSGGRLSEAIGRYPSLFGSLQLSLIEAGENSGRLEQAADEIANYLEKELSLRRKISGATLYPKLALVLMFIIVKLPIPALAESLGSLHYLPEVIIGGGIFLWLLLKLLTLISVFAHAWDSFKLDIPGMGSLVRKMALMKFGRSLGALYSAGISVATAVELAAGASGNICMAHRLSRAVPFLRKGVDLHSALSHTGVLTDLVDDMLSTGQMTGNLDEMMTKTADYYEAETESSLNKLLILLGVATLLLAAIMVGVVIVKFYSGMYGGMIG